MASESDGCNGEGHDRQRYSGQKIRGVMILVYPLWFHDGREALDLCYDIH